MVQVLIDVQRGVRLGLVGLPLSSRHSSQVGGIVEEYLSRKAIRPPTSVLAIKARSIWVPVPAVSLALGADEDDRGFVTGREPGAPRPFVGMLVVVQCEIVLGGHVGVQEQGGGRKRAARRRRVAFVPGPVGEEGRAARPLPTVSKPACRQIHPRRVGVGPFLWNCEDVVSRDVVPVIPNAPRSRRLGVRQVQFAPAVGGVGLALTHVLRPAEVQLACRLLALRRQVLQPNPRDLKLAK